MRRPALVLVAACAAFAFIARATAAGGQDVHPPALSGERDLSVITSQGVGRATGVPDVVSIGIGIETRAPSPGDALAVNNERTQAVIAALKERGVAEADLETGGGLSVNQHFDQGGRVAGYQATNSVNAKLRDLAGAGAVLNAAVAAAGDAARVRQVYFTIDDTDGLLAAARADAVHRARAQAEQMAAAAGVKLGKARSISEGSITTPPIPYSSHGSGGVPVPAGGAAPAPLLPGSHELTVSVVALFEIAD